MYIPPLPPGVNPDNTENRINIVKAINGDSLDIGLVLYNPFDHSPAKPENTDVKFVLSENRFSDVPYWTGTWHNGIVPHGSFPGSCTVIIPKDIMRSLRRGSYTYSVRVSSIDRRHVKTEAIGTIQIEYESVSPVHEIPYRDGSHDEHEDKRCRENTTHVPRMLPDYLYELDFDDSYNTEAEEFYKNYGSPVTGCSSVREGNVYGRNYDWTYSNAAEFIVKVNPGEGKYRSVGVSSLGSSLSNEDVISGKHNVLYKCLPGMTLDGINEAGVFANINVVSSSARDRRWEGTDICALGVVRHVLDNYGSAEEAAEYIASHTYIPHRLLTEYGYSFHFMIGDVDSTWIVEDGEAHLCEVAAMTNFRLYDDGLHTSREEVAMYDPYGSGIERYNILTGSGTVAERLKKARFTNAYRYPEYDWMTDFTDMSRGVTLYDIDGMRDLRGKAMFNFLKRTREDGKTWQTVHTSIYDIENRKLRVSVQENDDWYSFALPS